MARSSARTLSIVAAAVVPVLVASVLLVGRPRREPAATQPAAAAPPAAAMPAASSADVVLITIDTLRADALGFAGNQRVATPVLDRLAAAGRVFTDAHAHNVVTLASHANILTGLYPFQHGIRDNSGFVLPATVPTLATVLHERGYHTGAFVGAYPLDSRFGLTRGFDVYDDHYPRGSNPDDFVIAERRGDQVVAAALPWWNKQAGGRRFLWLHLYDPHAAYSPPEPFASRFRDAPYLGEVSAVDAFLTPLLEPLLAGKQRPTLVVVTADHGESLGEHGELTHGLFAYEATLRVPLVLWGVGVAPGRDGRMARHVDIVPTVLAVLGLPAPKGLPGRSLLGPPPAASETSYFESLSTNLNRGWAPLRGVVSGSRKFVELPLPELYDLAADPAEKHNLFESERRTAFALRQALPAESVWPPRKGAVSAEESARLKSLGYSTGSAAAKATYTAADDPKSLVGLDHKLHQVVDLYSRGRYEAAAALAGTVIAEHPSLPEAYEHRALALRQLERSPEAIETLRRGLAAGGGRESLRRQLGLALAEAGRAKEAITVLEPLADTAQDPATVNAYGIALSDAGRQDEAVAVLGKAVARYPGDPVGYQNLGIALLRRGKQAEAKARLQQALALNDRLPIAWNTLGVALYPLAGPEAALAAWQRAVALDPRQYDALFNIGLVAAQAGKNEEASRALRQFIDTAPPQRFAQDIAKAKTVLGKLGG